MTIVPILFGMVLMGYFSIHTFVSLHGGHIETRTRWFGRIRRDERPIFFWSLFLLGIALDLLLALALVDWATSR